MSIGDDWLVDLMIIYIEKTIAKALDINDIIKKIIGISTQRVQISQYKFKFDHLLKLENKIYIEYFHILRSTPPPGVKILATPLHLRTSHVSNIKTQFL